MNKTGISGMVTPVKHHGTFPHAPGFHLMADPLMFMGDDTETETCGGDETKITPPEKFIVSFEIKRSNFVPDAMDYSSTIVTTIDKGTAHLLPGENSKKTSNIGEKYDQTL